MTDRRTHTCIHASSRIRALDLFYNGSLFTCSARLLNRRRPSRESSLTLLLPPLLPLLMATGYWYMAAGGSREEDAPHTRVRGVRGGWSGWMDAAALPRGHPARRKQSAPVMGCVDDAVVSPVGVHLGWVASIDMPLDPSHQQTQSHRIAAAVGEPLLLGVGACAGVMLPSRARSTSIVYQLTGLTADSPTSTSPPQIWRCHRKRPRLDRWLACARRSRHHHRPATLGYVS